LLIMSAEHFPYSVITTPQKRGDIDVEVIYI